MKKKSWLVIVFLAGVTKVFAYPVETTMNAPLLTASGGKITQIGVIPQGSTLEVRTQRKNYLLIKWHGKVGWVSERAVRNRAPAAATATTGVPRRERMSDQPKLSFGASLGLQSGALSFGFGPHFFYRLPVSSVDRWDLGGGFYYLPGISSGFTSVSAVEVIAAGRWMRRFQKDMEFGAEAGLVLTSLNVSVNGAFLGLPETTSLGGTSFGILFGGAYTYEVADSLRLLAGLRILVSQGAGFLFSGGMEYRL